MPQIKMKNENEAKIVRRPIAKSQPPKSFFSLPAAFSRGDEVREDAPESWREKIRAQVKSLGPVEGLKAFVEQLDISAPFNPKHQLHINYDHDQARFDNLPSHWQQAQKHYGLPLALCPKIKKSFPFLKNLARDTTSKPSTDQTSTSIISDKVKKILFPLPSLKSFSSVPSYRETDFTSDTKEIKVPVILDLILERFIAMNGLNAEGVFRLAPDSRECTKTKVLLNTGRVKEGLNNCTDVHILANLIKQFFRDLQPCLLENLTVAEIMNISLEEFEPNQIIYRLTKLERDSFMWLLEVLANVAIRKDVNRMSAKNLAIVIAPNLYTKDLVTNSDNIAEASANALLVSQKIAAIVNKLLESVIAKHM